MMMMVAMVMMYVVMVAMVMMAMFLVLAVFPNKCVVSLVAMGNCFEYQSSISFWDDVFGKRALYVA